jgi:two-component system, cell cycle response regulator DivK
MSHSILVIDDDLMHCDMILRRLSLRGYRVVGAVDGSQGIDVARAERPDLILMDINLPEMDGWETTRRLKSDETTRHIPVVALTAHAMTTDRVKALQAGCDDYATKPIDFERLLEKMEALLCRKAAR